MAKANRFVKLVTQFLRQEGIDRLNSGHLSCPECGPDTYDKRFVWTDEDVCPKCGADRETMDEPYFSKHRCECCCDVAGDRVHATANNRETGDIQEYSVCEDCILYFERGTIPKRED